MIKPPELLHMVSQTPGAPQLLSSALFAASERSPDPLGDLLWQLGDRLQACVIKGSWEAILPCYGQIEF